MERDICDCVGHSGQLPPMRGSRLKRCCCELWPRHVTGCKAMTAGTGFRKKTVLKGRVATRSECVYIYIYVYMYSPAPGRI